MSVKPAEGRGGSPNPLASVRRKGLKKAASTNVVADLTSRPAVTQAEAPSGTQASEPAEAQSVEEQPPTAADAAPAQKLPRQQEQKAGERRGVSQDQPAPAASPTSEVTGSVTRDSGPQQAPSDAKPIEPIEASPEGPEAIAKPAKKPMRKVNFHQSADAGRRMRATYLATRHLTGYRSLSDFICSLIERECDALEETYNDGHPFIVDADGIPRGRPIEL